jgi:hypothetical protein
MAFRVTRFRVELEPSVATSLRGSVTVQLHCEARMYQIVATPYWRLVRTVVVSWVKLLSLNALTVVAVKHGDYSMRRLSAAFFWTTVQESTKNGTSAWIARKNCTLVEKVEGEVVVAIN